MDPPSDPIMQQYLEARAEFARLPYDARFFLMADAEAHGAQDPRIRDFHKRRAKTIWDSITEPSIKLAIEDYQHRMIRLTTDREGI